MVTSSYASRMSKIRLLALIIVENIAHTACTGIIIAGRANAQLLTFCCFIAFDTRGAILFVLSVRTIQHAIANMLLIYAYSAMVIRNESVGKNRPRNGMENVANLLGVCGVFIRRTRKLAHVTVNRTVDFIFGALAINETVTEPRSL